jgi:hypothetical protein
MGYCIDLMGTTVSIDEADEAAALAAIKNLNTKDRRGNMGGGSYSGGEQTDWWYAWVNMKGVDNATPLGDALRAWRCGTRRLDGKIHIIHFTGEKMGDQRYLYEAIAPYATGHLTWLGEDGERWRDVFADGKHREQWAETIWRD